MTAKVKIKLKQPHPRGQMSHGNHVITTEFQELDFNADEMAALKTDGPKHWFDFKVMKELTKDDQAGIDRLAKEQEEAAAKLLKEEAERKELAELEEKERLENLEKEALLKQQQDEEANKNKQGE